MAILGIIGTIIGWIKFGIGVWHLVSEILELIKLLKDPQEREAAMVELKSEHTHYKRNKDRRPLERLRDRLRDRCFGECKP